MNPQESANVCKCKHHKVVPVLVILLGLTFLAANLNWLSWSAVGIIWPILIIVAGAAKLCKCCGKKGMM